MLIMIIIIIFLIIINNNYNFNIIYRILGRPFSKLAQFFFYIYQSDIQRL